jgi:hypothetical protein
VVKYILSLGSVIISENGITELEEFMKLTIDELAVLLPRKLGPQKTIAAELERMRASSAAATLIAEVTTPTQLHNPVNESAPSKADPSLVSSKEALSTRSDANEEGLLSKYGFVAPVALSGAAVAVGGFAKDFGHSLAKKYIVYNVSTPLFFGNEGKHDAKMPGDESLVGADTQTSTVQAAQLEKYGLSGAKRESDLPEVQTGDILLEGGVVGTIEVQEDIVLPLESVGIPNAVDAEGVEGEETVSTGVVDTLFSAFTNFLSE